jgi:two-component system, chemotaxis family, sensor kinase CheA
MGKRILIIDDSKLSREMTRMTLEQGGFSVDGVGSANEALEKLKGDPYDLVILDLILPGLDGFTFLEMLRNSDTFKNVPVMVLSSRDSKEEKERVRHFGITTYMVKHLAHPAEVLKTVKTIID